MCSAAAVVFLAPRSWYQMLQVCFGCDKEQSAGLILGDTCVQVGSGLETFAKVLFPEANFRNIGVYQDHWAAFLDLCAQLHMSS